MNVLREGLRRVRGANEFARSGRPATDGAIAAINLESARRRAWARFAENPRRPGAAETIVESERFCAQFLGDVSALDRLHAVTSQVARVDQSFRAALLHAEVASTVHRFDDARTHLAAAALMGAPHEKIEQQLLTIDQACGVDLDAVLAARRRIAEASGRLNDFAMLAAVLVDMERFEEADAVYRQALYSYDDVSPLPLAWVFFQLGMLWGELADQPEPDLAEHWYRCAVDYLPGYVRARVHLAELVASQGHFSEAEALLRPALASADPEVRWRLGDVLIEQKQFEEADSELAAARAGFEALLEKYPLAFADHAAEFYASSGNDAQRALELARANVANRPTRRAVNQMLAIEASVDIPIHGEFQ